jgi:hypothetical protein
LSKPQQTYTKQTFRLLENLLYARRNGNVMREQRAYDLLYAHCLKRGVDFATVLREGPALARRNNVAVILNGA